MNIFEHQNNMSFPLESYHSTSCNNASCN